MNASPPPASPPQGEPVAFSPRPAPGPVRLTGRFVTLAPLDPAAHGDDLHAQAGGPAQAGLWTYLGDGPFSTREAFDDNLAAKARSTDPLFFAILAGGDGAPAHRRAVGHAALMRTDAANGVVEVGHILFGPALAKTPAATEAMALLASHVFDDLGYRRYEWKCNSLNAPSRRAAERLGFVYEGLFRQHRVDKGRNRDTAWFSMLDGEWPRAKAAFEAWLAPENFDSRGRQIHRLEDFR